MSRVLRSEGGTGCCYSAGYWLLLFNWLLLFRIQTNQVRGKFRRET